MVLSSGIFETGNDHLENHFNDGKIKLSSDWGQYEERREQEGNGSVL